MNPSSSLAPLYRVKLHPKRSKQSPPPLSLLMARFSFSFRGDDIEDEDGGDVEDEERSVEMGGQEEGQREGEVEGLVRAREWGLEEMVSFLLFSFLFFWYSFYGSWGVDRELMGLDAMDAVLCCSCSCGHVGFYSGTSCTSRLSWSGN